MVSGPFQAGMLIYLSFQTVQCWQLFLYNSKKQKKNLYILKRCSQIKSDWLRNEFSQSNQSGSKSKSVWLQTSGFSQGHSHMGGDMCRGQSVNGGGGLMRGDIDLMGGPNFDRLYHKLKVLLLLSCNYMMEFIGYNSIKTCWFVSYLFQIRTITQHQYKRIRAINRIM